MYTLWDITTGNYKKNRLLYILYYDFEQKLEPLHEFADQRMGPPLTDFEQKSFRIFVFYFLGNTF